MIRGIGRKSAAGWVAHVRISLSLSLFFSPPFGTGYIYRRRRLAKLSPMGASLSTYEDFASVTKIKYEREKRATNRITSQQTRRKQNCLIVRANRY